MKLKNKGMSKSIMLHQFNTVLDTVLNKHYEDYSHMEKKSQSCKKMNEKNNNNKEHYKGKK